MIVRAARKNIKKNRNLKEDSTHPILQNSDSFIVFIALSYFLSFIFILGYFPGLDLSLFQLLQFFTLFLGLSFAVPIRLYRKFLPISIYEYILFNVLSFAPLFIAVIFILNDHFNGKTYIESYRIVKTERLAKKTLFTLEENAYHDKEYLRSIRDREEVEIRGKENLAIYFSEGLFGIRIIEKKRVY